jgi:hypothetical protein
MTITWIPLVETTTLPVIMMVVSVETITTFKETDYEKEFPLLRSCHDGSLVMHP